MTLQSMAMRKRSAWRWLQAGDRLDLGGVELRVHHPGVSDWERQKVRNDDSLVIELRYGQVSMLLTGDIGREVEQALIPTLDLLPIVVLKSPHHGSGTSSSQEFIEKLKPRVVVIGVGRANPYGHPVPHVLERYEASGCDVFRTDRDGQIEVETDGPRLRIRHSPAGSVRFDEHDGSKNHGQHRSAEPLRLGSVSVLQRFCDPLFVAWQLASALPAARASDLRNAARSP